jgi:hypothetical protein
MKQLALSLGLPTDKLSQLLLSFLRYFSLPLNPDMIARLRREALSFRDGGKVQSAAQPREASVLAAAAAADKGISLSPGALEQYIRAIEGRLEPPDREGGQPLDADRARPDSKGPETDAERHGSSRPDTKGPSGNNSEREQGGHSGNEAPAPEKPAKAHKTEAAPLEYLREKLESIEANFPLLSILNTLPGRNGQRWIVIPLNLEAENVEYRGSLRILLYGAESSRCKAERLVMALAEYHKDGNTAGRRWLFTLIKGGEPESCLDVRMRPPPADPEILKNELRGLLGVYAGNIEVGALTSESGLLQGEYGLFPETHKEVYY